MTTDFHKAFDWPLQLPEIRDALTTAFDTGQWGKYDGHNTRELTAALKAYFETEFVRLCASGTVAIEIALQAVGVKPGDEVILAGYDFPGNFRCIESTGGIPVLADIDLPGWSLNLTSFQESISEKTKAVIVSHLHGGVAEIGKIYEVARQNQIRVIEDICQCPGAAVDQRKLGTWADVTALSFGGSKLLSAGRGGALITNDESVFQRAKIFCDRGNNAFPLSELQAAVLIPQLNRLDELNEKRNAAFASFLQQVEPSELFTTLSLQSDVTRGFYKVPLLVEPNVDKQELINQLRALGILIDHGFKGFAGRSSRRCKSPVPLSNSIRAATDTLVLHHPCLLSPDFEPIVNQIKVSATACRI